MTLNNVSEWNAGEIPVDANNLADWPFEINEMTDFDFGDIPPMAPVAQSSSNDVAELRDGSTAGTAAINSTCSHCHCQCAQAKSFETLMNEIRQIVAQAREDQMEAVERRITSLEARAALVEGIVQDVKDGVGKHGGRLDRYSDQIEDLFERIDNFNNWLHEAHDKVEYLMDNQERDS
ncbi:hypothetical protein OCU04_009826 [Sclerotinia nivalis]|uniref:Uncharacterized protein n=1 Tax=Sclerotinia nivalis TaxID=352851 RepID=A0A9X0AFV4_9HELO|nr:hypothetical protein OCU04_009826 [Sclerotinia nivalis]